LPKKKIAEKEPVIAMDATVGAAVKAKKATVKEQARAPRASASAVTHKHKKTTNAATPAVPAHVEAAAPVAEPTHEEIAKLAYSFWEARGYQGGSQDEDWLRAVQQLRNR
jgi:hypothetical protein